MADDAKKAAVLSIVRQVLICESKDTDTAEKVLPECYEDLQDGVFLYRILSHVAPQSFPDAGEFNAQEVGSRQNWVMRRGKIKSLVRRMNDHIHQYFSAPHTLNLELLINAADVAASPAQDDDELRGHVDQKGMARLMELMDFFLVIIVFSGDSVVLRALKLLPYSEKLLLSNAAKTCITKHALRPRRRDETSALKDMQQAGAAHCVTELTHGGGSLTSGVRQQSFYALDDESLHCELLRLRRELEDANSKVMELESKLQFAVIEKQEWESKYRNLIGEVEQQRSASATTEHLRQLLEKKEMTIKSLTETAEEHAKKIVAFKEATAAQEAALGVMKRKLTQTQGELMKQNVERREALEKLAVAEEKLSAQVNACNELERELEDLRRELAITKAQSNNTTDNELRLNRSFSSVNSVDRLVQLENELDEVRGQKEAAERLLNILQRQVSSLPSDGLVSSATTDALKAQLRQAEREKEELRKQLAATIARWEEAQCPWKGRGGGQSIIDGETESLIAGDKSGRAEVDVGTSPQKNGVGVDRHGSQLRGKCDENYMREQAVLASNLLLFGYRNLMLQQRALLASNRSIISDRCGVKRVSDCVLCTQRDEKETNEQENMRTGSLLTQHRNEIEKGLFESVFGRSL